MRDPQPPFGPISPWVPRRLVCVIISMLVSIYLGRVNSIYTPSMHPAMPRSSRSSHSSRQRGYDGGPYGCLSITSRASISRSKSSHVSRKWLAIAPLTVVTGRFCMICPVRVAFGNCISRTSAIYLGFSCQQCASSRDSRLPAAIVASESSFHFSNSAARPCYTYMCHMRRTVPPPLRTLVLPQFFCPSSSP